MNGPHASQRYIIMECMLAFGSPTVISGLITAIKGQIPDIKAGYPVSLVLDKICMLTTQCVRFTHGGDEENNCKLFSSTSKLTNTTGKPLIASSRVD